MPSKRRTLMFAVGGTALALLGCCGGITAFGMHDNDKEPAVAAPVATTDPAYVGPDNAICRVNDPDTGGSYYLTVASATWHNFDACAGATPFSGTLDDLLNLPGMDTRCMAPDDFYPHALVGVYSGRGKDLHAAQAYCREVHGTN